jgi:ABC-type nickel/cobalt efflux system permease component RcnA
VTPEIAMLALSAAAIAFAHTVLGPDHYLPFVAMAKSRGWSMVKTLRITLICGVGHLAGSVVLGVVGIALGVQLSALNWMEGARGNLAAWMLIGFGLAYTAWGIRQAHRRRPHTHWHHHDGVTHLHEHSHREAHAHVHDRADGSTSLTPWLIFVIFVLGPCEPLIPLLMYPAARESTTGVVVVTVVFGMVTVLTMSLAVAIALLGLKTIKISRLEPYGHAVAGSAILACGLAIALLGI